jgi:hypothetical protein
MGRCVMLAGTQTKSPAWAVTPSESVTHRALLYLPVLMLRKHRAWLHRHRRSVRRCALRAQNRVSYGALLVIRPLLLVRRGLQSGEVELNYFHHRSRGATRCRRNRVRYSLKRDTPGLAFARLGYQVYVLTIVGGPGVSSRIFVRSRTCRFFFGQLAGIFAASAAINGAELRNSPAARVPY